jgi:hypothetical protein
MTDDKDGTVVSRSMLSLEIELASEPSELTDLDACA